MIPEPVMADGSSSGQRHRLRSEILSAFKPDFAERLDLRNKVWIRVWIKSGGSNHSTVTP